MTAVEIITDFRELNSKNQKCIFFRVLFYQISEFKMPPKIGKTRKSSNDKRNEFLGPSKEFLEDDHRSKLFSTLFPFCPQIPSDRHTSPQL